MFALSDLPAGNFTKTLIVAFSGGVDSTVLLHHLVTITTNTPWQVQAVHVNHQLQPQAQAWSEHCQAYCAQLGVDCQVRHIDVNDVQDESLEAAARRLRYQALAEFISDGAILVTAHHQTDQAETLLLQLCRGAGPKGLAAMPSLKAFHRGWHWRPLLHIDRPGIEAYAQQHQLAYVEDGSNQDQRFSRNFMRHEILPRLQQHYPNISANLARSAKHCASLQALVDDVSAADVLQCQGTDLQTLSVSPWQRLSSARQDASLRFWLHAQGASLPSTEKLQAIKQQMCSAQADKNPMVTWAGQAVARYRNKLYFLPQGCPEVPAAEKLVWPDLTTPLALPCGRQIVLASAAKAALTNISVGYRQGGERLQLPGRKHRHCLKKLLQDWQVPPWQRTTIPLVFNDDELVAVVGYSNSAWAQDQGLVFQLL